MKGFIYIIFAFVFSACSTNVVSFYVVGESAIQFETFSFYDRDTEKLRPQQKSLDSLIELSISNVLISKGFKEQNNSDVYVSYSITLGTSSTSNVDNQHYDSYSNRAYYPYNYNYNVTTTNYKEGVLLIEFWSKEEKLLWQGSKSFKVRKSINTRELFISYAKEITASFKANL